MTLLPESAARIAVLGVGSDLRGDDAAVWAVRALRGRIDGRRMAVFEGGSAPENLTGAIGRFAPTHLVLIDAAHLGLPPGSVRRVDRGRVGKVAFSTHLLPLPVLIEYLERSTGCRSIVIGIQPATTELFAPPSPRVARAASKLAGLLARYAQRPAASSA
jgi:hydrogenase 3 maturation protease